MKTLIFITLLFSCQALAHINPFIGSWQLISGEYVDEEGNTKDYKALKLTAMKLVTEHHYSFITKSGDKFWASGAGSYRYDQGSYIESPMFASYDAANEYRFTFKMVGNQWHSSRWKEGKRVEFEIWQRIAINPSQKKASNNH